MTYSLDAFLDEEGSQHYVLGELLMLVSRFRPAATTSFNTTLVFYNSHDDSFRFGHDVELDKEFTLTSEELRVQVKSAIARSLEIEGHAP